MARAADLMRYNTLLGVKGINVRNTFIEFEEEDSYGHFDGKTGFGRQASEPAKPCSWNRQVSEQTTAITAEGTEESAIDVDDTMHLSPSDFQTMQGHVPGEMLAHASRSGSGDVAFLDAIKAVMTQMTQGAPMTSSMPANPPKPQLRFCPSCGAKVLSQAHRFCAYCCFPFGQLQDETIPPQPAAQQQPLLSSSPMPSSMGAVEQALLANMQASAPMPSQPVMPGKVSKGSKANKPNQQPDNGNLLSNLRHFRYMEANQLDVELARVLCLTHIRDSIQVAS
mmetsp:Transcript_79240/g.96901  ORF Transcript_79240/g.96901 Transcript_79240/m.96901 type:complete len:281 (-) Transcript_79240:22-864(-)